MAAIELWIVTSIELNSFCASSNFKPQTKLNIQISNIKNGEKAKTNRNNLFVSCFIVKTRHNIITATAWHMQIK